MGFSDARLAELTCARTRRPSARRGGSPVSSRCSSASTPAPPSSRRARPICIRRYEGDGFSTPESEDEADRSQEGRDPRRRAEPHRPGHRIRLLLRARGLRAARGRVRDHHGQLQSGNRLDRLRHLGPPVFRAADRRGRDRSDPARADQWRSGRRDRAVRRTDTAEARQGADRCRHPDPRHLVRRHRRGRGSRPLPEASPQAEAAASPPAARPIRWRKRKKRRPRSAIRFCCGRPMCWADAR